MNPITSFVKRYPQPIFWGISYLTAYTGYILSVRYPSDLWIFFVWGTFLGGALVTALADGRRGLKTFFSRIVRWRVGIQWYAVALLLPVVVWLAATGLNLASGAVLVTDIPWPAWTDMLTGFLFIFLTISLGEEPGFRGFALPRLLVGRSALVASLILGVLHAIWHLPLLISGDLAPINILVILSGAVMFTWLFNHTRGSVLIAMLLHTSVDLCVELFNPLFAGSDAARLSIWVVVVYVAVAVLLRLLSGPELGRRPEPASSRMAADQPLAAK